MSRRAGIAAAALVIAAAAPLAAQQPPRTEVRTEQIARGLHRITRTAPGEPNVLALVGDDGVVLVDAGGPEAAGELIGAVGRVASRPVRVVINTHYHPDHLGANPRLRAGGALLVAHARVAAQALKDTLVEELRWQRRPAPVAALPMLTFDRRLELQLNGDSIAVIHFPRAHTDGDAVVFFRRANVLHTGDLVEFGAYPFIDWWAGGMLDGTIAATDSLLALANDSTRIVPGHGPVATRAEVVEYRRMLTTVRTRARQGVTAGRSLEAWLASRPTREFDDGRWGSEEQGRSFATQVYRRVARAGTPRR